MKKIIFLFALSNYTLAQTWVNVGSPNFTNGSADYIFSATAPNGDPYVVYRENSIAAGRVKKFNGKNWIAVGANFSLGDVSCTTMAFDNKGVPYVAYSDEADSNKATVMKFDGNNWIPVGSIGFTPGSATYTSIAIDGNGIPYLAFRDQGSSSYNSWPNGFRASVMKFDGTNWVYVGNPGFSGGSGPYGALYTSLTIDKNGLPYVAYSDFSNDSKATVMKFDGTNWVYVGNPGFSSWQSNNTSIVLDSKGSPYVAYSDRANNGKATVMMFDGSNWIPVGIAGLTPDIAQYTSLAIDKNDILYLAFEDHSQDDKASITKYDGTKWVYVGSPGFSDSAALFTTIAIDNNKGILYAAYEDLYNGKTNNPKWDATVMKFDIVTGIEANEKNYSLSIYPNPVNNIVTLNIQSSEPKEEFTLLVVSASGQSVYSEIIKDISGTFTKQINLSALPKGSYFIELQPTSINSSGNRSISEIKKIILQ